MAPKELAVLQRNTHMGEMLGAQADSFPNLRRLEGCVVGLSGTIEHYRGRPQIILTDPSQIE